MKRILLLILLSLSFVNTRSQTLNCNLICISNIEIDSLTGEMLVTVYNGDTVHVNYPIVQVIDQNGDTIGNPAGLYIFFAHMPGTTVEHSIPATVSSLPNGFTATVLFIDPLWNISCSFNYPMNCFIGQPPPDCDDLTVKNISIDSVAGLMDITLFNSCNNCASGMNGPVYCEMKVIRNVAPFDTLAESNCFCFLTPDNNSFQTYTLTSYVTTLPPISDINVIFHCGSGICDTLQINPLLNISVIDINKTIQVYPNPANGVITIKLEKETREILLFEMTGKLLHSFSPNENEMILDISHLASGIYLISIDGINYKLVRQ